MARTDLDARERVAPRDVAGENTGPIKGKATHGTTEGHADTESE